MLTNGKDVNQWQLLHIVEIHWKSIWQSLVRLNIHIPNDRSNEYLKYSTSISIVSTCKSFYASHINSHFKRWQ